jgi:hypothetical protein
MPNRLFTTQWWNIFFSKKRLGVSNRASTRTTWRTRRSDLRLDTSTKFRLFKPSNSPSRFTFQASRQLIRFGPFKLLFQVADLWYPYQGILIGEVLLYRWPPVWLVWNRCMTTTDNFCFYLQNRLIQTSQRYSDTSSPLVFPAHIDTDQLREIH